MLIESLPNLEAGFIPVIDLIRFEIMLPIEIRKSIEPITNNPKILSLDTQGLLQTLGNKRDMWR